MTDFQKLFSIEPILSKRCARCQFVFGRERPENVSLLRCPECDYPLHESEVALRAIAFALQSDGATNVYSTVVCYVWLQVVRDGIDLAIEPYLGADNFGTVPEWFDYEIGQSGWDSVISPDFVSWRANEAVTFAGTWNNWALEQGLCPSQAFLVEMKHPHYYKTGGYECPEEWDVEYTWDIVMREPRSPRQAARAWEQWRKKCVDTRQAVCRAAARLQRRRERVVDEMYIQYDSFWSHHYDEMSYPDGVVVRLCSKLGHWDVIAEGRSDRKRDDGHGDARERAWAALLDDVKARLPHLDPEVVRKLPSRI